MKTTSIVKIEIQSADGTYTDLTKDFKGGTVEKDGVVVEEMKRAAWWKIALYRLREWFAKK